MAQITDKPLKLEQARVIAKDYSEKLNKKVDAEEGKGLYPDTDKEKLAGVEAQANVNKLEGVKINGVELVIGEDKKVDITPEKLATDLEEYVKDTELTEQLTPYLKSSDAESTYVKEEGFNEKVKASVGSVYRPKGSLANLEAIKAVETPTEGDVYNATDSGANYVYVGEGQGEDESGWDKLSETVDLSGFMQTATANEKFAEKTTVEALSDKVDGLDGALKESDIVFATDPEVEAQLALGAQDAQSPAA